MGKITRNRVIYAGTDVLISDSPSWESQTNFSNLKLLKRIQSSSISISNPVSRSRQVGSSDYAFQKYTESPQIEVGLSYYLSDNSNEVLLGLISDSSSGIFSNFAEAGGDKNLYFVLTDDEAQDADSITDAVGLDIFAVGNAFLNNYSLSAQVGDLPSVSLSFDCVNMTFDNYSGFGTNGSQVPAINLPQGTKSTEKYLLSGYNFNTSNYLSNQSQRASALRPGDINLELQQPVMGGVRYSGEAPANITSMQISLPVSRKDLVGFGSNFPYDKRIIFPIVGTVGFEGSIDEPVTGDFSKIFDDENEYDLVFNLKNSDGSTGFRVEIDNARVESQSFSQSVGGDMTFSSEFSFSVSATAGFKVSGSSSLFVDDQDAINFLDTVQEKNTTVRSGINTFVKNLKSDGLWDKMSGVYPLVGETSYYGYNLKDPRNSDDAYRLTFSTVDTVKEFGYIAFSGEYDYANTHFNPSTNLTGTPVHISVLNILDQSSATADIGCIETSITSYPRLALLLDFSGGGYTNDASFQFYNPDAEEFNAVVREVNSKAFYIASRSSSSSAFLSLFNTSEVPTKTNTSTFSEGSSAAPNLDIFIGAANIAGSPQSNVDADRQYGFLSIGDGLSSSESVALYNSVKTLHSDIGRDFGIFS